jgi:hypothetical protein
LQRTVPVLLASTMDAMKGFYDEVSRANSSANAFTREAIVPLETARQFSPTIVNIVNTAREEKAYRGGVFLSEKGRPPSWIQARQQNP